MTIKLALALLAWGCIASFAETITAWAAKPVTVERLRVSKQSGYFPLLIKLRNGDLFGVIRAGDLYTGINGRLDTVRSLDRGHTWSQQVLFDSEMDDRNPADGLAVCQRRRRFPWHTGQTARLSAPQAGFGRHFDSKIDT
jgi:hypothetical protein